jgi:hypothetical protein
LMSKKKTVEVRGVRYVVRGLTFDELVKLGLADVDGKASRTVVAEVLGRCLVEPKMKNEDIMRLDDMTLVTLVAEVLDIAKSGVMEMGFVPMPPDKEPPRDMIA